MKIVIQCAASKVPGAGSLMGARGRPVLFVANPSLAPRSSTHSYAHPDEPTDQGKTWRERAIVKSGVRPDQAASLLFSVSSLFTSIPSLNFTPWMTLVS